jgi:hypothetical protein
MQAELYRSHQKRTDSLDAKTAFIMETKNSGWAPQLLKGTPQRTSTSQRFYHLPKVHPGDEASSTWAWGTLNKIKHCPTDLSGVLRWFLNQGTKEWPPDHPLF